MRFLKPVLFVAIALFVFSSAAQAQCKVFTKKKCIPYLPPYVNNGQYNGATLFEGESADLLMTFYSGQDYRLLVCAQDVFSGPVKYRVMDSDGTELYNNDKNPDQPWDFSVGYTQTLKVEIDVPASNSASELVKSGCVSILIGFKE